MITGDGTISNAGLLTVTGLQGTAIDTTLPNNGQVLSFNSSSGKWVPTTPSGGGSSKWILSDSKLYPNPINDWYSLQWGSGNSTASQSTAFGSGTASASQATAFGSGTASGYRATAWGTGTTATQSLSTAWGDGADATANLTTAWGQNTTANSNLATAWGSGTTASGNMATAWGNNTIANQQFATAWGQNTTATAGFTTAWGDNTDATSEYATAFGQNSLASGQYSTAFGKNSIASNQYTTAFGLNSIASGTYSTAFGLNDTASGAHSLSFGEANLAFGTHSTAFGKNTNALGVYSTAFGQNDTASGTHSLAFGEANLAFGTHSTAFGKNTKALGVYSTAFGQNDTASGTHSLAFGEANKASGTHSTAFGKNTNALGVYSTSFGFNTTAYSGMETVIGQYNTVYSPQNAWGWNTPDRVFVIGNGTANNSRSDALIIKKTGDAEMYGNLSLKSPTGAAKELRLYESPTNGTNYTAFFADSQATNITYRLPKTLDTVNMEPDSRVLVSKPNGNTSTLSWVSLKAIGGSYVPVNQISTNTNATEDNTMIVITSNNTTITLPLASSLPGKVFYVALKSGIGPGTVATSGSDKINASQETSSIVFEHGNNKVSAALFVSDGISTWYVITTRETN